MKLTNIYNDKRKLYLFCRNEKGELEIKEDNSFFPYFYESDPQEGKFKSFTGESLRKVFVSNPSDVPKQRTDKAWEADIIYTRRYMIDKIAKLDKCPIKYTFIDIEVLADELPNVEQAKQPVSCISFYNSVYKSIQTLYLEDYETEYKMIEHFINCMKKEKFDLWLSWNVGFDYNYLANRYPDFAEKVSIIGKTRYGDGKVYYPAGISIVDYLQWDKKVTLNRRKSYALDNVSQEELKDAPNEKIEFGKLSPKIKAKNRRDVERMVKLEEKLQYISYFDEIRRLTKVEWEDMIWNSRIIDMLLLEEAKNRKVVLPMKPAEDRGTLSEKEDFQGAYREAFKTGRFETIGVYDLGSAYPYAIIDFCLDSANIYKYNPEREPRPNSIDIEETTFEQNSNALLPTIVKKLINLKKEYKGQGKKYDAIKTVVNSAYGVFGNRFFRLYDKNVASATTFIVRSLLHYVQEKLEIEGHDIIYVDTDSIMINNNNNDISNALNEYVKQWAKEKYNKDNVDIEFEYKGYFNPIIILAKCRYKGWLVTDKGIEPKTKGIEAKRKDSTIYMKKFQIELLDKIKNNETKESIFDWIKAQILYIKNEPLKDIAFPCRLAKKPEEYKNVPIFVRALNNTPDFEKKVGNNFYYIFVKPDDNLKVKTVIHVHDYLPSEDPEHPNRLEDYIETLDKDLSRKEGIEYIRTKLQKPELETSKIKVLHQKEKAKDVMAFDEENYKHINRDKVDWDMIIKRNITMKLVTIFEAMGWDIKELLFKEE